MESGPSGRGGPRSGRDLKIVEDGSELEGSSGRKLTLGKLDMADMVLDFGCFRNGGSPGKARRGGGSEMDLGTLDISRKALGTLDMCHHRDRGQILTTTLVITVSILFSALTFHKFWS